MNDMVPKAGDFIIQQRGGKEIRKFRKIRLIGKGGFAEVFQCHDSKSDKDVAVKILNREKISKINGAREKLMTEVSIHKCMDHPNIVKFEEFFEDYYHFYIVLELCTDENLETRLKREKVFSDEDTIIYMKQLLDALIYLRNKKIIHRDLKLANLFVKDGTNIKLGDFGLACKHENPNRKRKSICGTPNYIAPEILSGEGHTYPVDVWAVGILLYAMLIGKPPFETTNMKSTYNRIQSCMYVFPPDTSIDVEAKSLIMKVLTKHPNKRPTYESILESPYFLGESPRNPMSQIEQEGDTDQTRPKIVKPQKLNLKPQFTQKVPLKKMASYRRQNEEVAIPKLTEQVEDNKDSGKKDGQPVLERQKFYKKLFTNEFRGKMGSDSKISDMNAHTYRSSLSRKDTLISRDEIATNRAVKNEPLRISQELSKPIVSEKKINDDKDISDKMMDKGGKEQESSIIKRIMTNMTNTVNQDSPQDAPNVPQTTSAGNLITKKYAKQNSLIGKQGDSASKVNVQRHSLVVESSEAYQLGKSSINSSSLAPPESSSKKISAFDIIKNSSRVNSMTNSMIADDTVRREMVSEAKVIEPSENDRMTEEKSKPRMERDSSVKSASKKQRKMLFQRMIEDRIQSDTHREDKQVTDRLIIPGENQGQPARMRAASLRIHDADNRLIKTLLEGDTIVSPSNAEDISPENKDSLSNRDKIKHERSSSAHPALKIKSLWQTQEVEDKEEEAFEPGDYVKKWIDHSAKYGLVSIMHSGIISILFNDMTKVIFRINGEKFVYLSRSQSKQREEVRIYPLGLPPRNFEKKMGIINDIIRTLSNHQKDLNLSGGTDSFLSGSKDRVHVKNWVKAKQVIVFKLSNGIYQALFQDKSELLMSSKNERFLFVDKDRKRYSHTLNSNEIQKNRSVNVRVEYFKRVLKKWIERDSASTHLPSRVNHDLDV